MVFLSKCLIFLYHLFNWYLWLTQPWLVLSFWSSSFYFWSWFVICALGCECHPGKFAPQIPAIVKLNDYDTAQTTNPLPQRLLLQHLLTVSLSSTGRTPFEHTCTVYWWHFWERLWDRFIEANGRTLCGDWNPNSRENFSNFQQWHCRVKPKGSDEEMSLLIQSNKNMERGR